MKRFLAPSLLGLALCLLSGAARAEDAWTVGKSSGEAWLAAAGAQPVSLSASATLKPGDNIRTGQNGRVLLTRGEETILIAPNSVVGIPTEKKDGLSTTILQKAGSILLEVEKRKENHFEVETPYLAAVVKGTQFRVSVGKYDTRVSVLRGRVEVTDFKTGEHAAVLPGQTAKVLPQGRAGLFLSGAGALAPVQPGTPRAPSIEPPAPKRGLTTAHNASNGVVRISAPLGEVNLDMKKATKGFARDAGSPPPANGTKREADTVWGSGELAPGNAAAQGNGGGNSGGNGGNAGGNAGGNGNGNALGHLSCNPRSKGKGGC